MVEDIERRKSELLASLEVKYAGKPKKWWQNDALEYTSTKALATKCKKFDSNAAEVIIRTKIFYGIAIVIFFLTGVLVQVLPLPENIKFSFNPLFFIIFSIGLIYYTARVINRKPRIIVNTNGICTDKINKIIIWGSVAGTFIQRTGSDGDFYYLVVHYFDHENDRFQELEYRIDELDIKNEDLAFYIEKFHDQNRLATII